MRRESTTSGPQVVRGIANWTQNLRLTRAVRA
jgi:hypothetical protein